MKVKWKSLNKGDKVIIVKRNKNVWQKRCIPAIPSLGFHLVHLENNVFAKYAWILLYSSCKMSFLFLLINEHISIKSSIKWSYYMNWGLKGRHGRHNERTTNTKPLLKNKL